MLSPSLLDTLASAPAYRFPKTAHPYVHQLQAWRTLLDETPRSAVITTGTGSGKTECFMVPILEDLIREHERSEAALVGVRALFLYPLNALINSQQERLDAWTRKYSSNIRFCLYNGKTEERADKVRKEQQQKPNQILSRELLRKEPAPILMTNATMLEYMLVRQVDNPILEISRQQNRCAGSSSMRHTPMWAPRRQKCPCCCAGWSRPLAGSPSRSASSPPRPPSPAPMRRSD